MSRISDLSSGRKFIPFTMARCVNRDTPRKSARALLAYGVWPTLGKEQPTSPR